MQRRKIMGTGRRSQCGNRILCRGVAPLHRLGRRKDTLSRQ